MGCLKVRIGVAADNRRRCADAVGYLGRAESSTECEALAEWGGAANCRPLDGRADSRRGVYEAANYPAANCRPLDGRADGNLRACVGSRSRLVPRRLTRRRPTSAGHNLPTVARFLLTGRSRPRIKDAVTIGELMRRAALGQFGWRRDESTGRRIPNAPWEISGRDADGKPLQDPSHAHAFLAAGRGGRDGWIDHVSVLIAGGMNDSVRGALDRNTRLWLARNTGSRTRRPTRQREGMAARAGRLRKPADFAGGARIFATSRCWRSVTPFLASGRLKASGYAGEVRRLLKRRGLDVTDVRVDELETIGGRWNSTTGGPFSPLPFPRPGSAA